MDQLVYEQPPAGRCGQVVPAAAEEYVLAMYEGGRADRLRRLGRGLVGVQPYAAQIATERAFQPGAYGRLEWPSDRPERRHAQGRDVRLAPARRRPFDPLRRGRRYPLPYAA